MRETSVCSWLVRAQARMAARSPSKSGESHYPRCWRAATMLKTRVCFGWASLSDSPIRLSQSSPVENTMNLNELALTAQRSVFVGMTLLCVACNDTAPTSSTDDLPAEPTELIELAEPTEVAAPTQIAETDQSNSNPQIAFSINGQEMQFDYLAADESAFTPYASSIKARPAEDSAESLTILFLSADLSKLDYPIELPVRQGGSNSILQMATIGFGYIDDEGNEWAGPGKVTLDSFEAGTLTGSFGSVKLPHTEKTLADIMIGNGYFQAQLDQ